MAEVTSDNWDTIEKEAEEYLLDQKSYHIDNKLAFNEDKTIIMFNSRKKINKKKKINFNDKILKHSEKVEILGLVYNDKLNFKNHIEYGTKNKKSLILRINRN